MSDRIEALNAALRGRYRVIRPLGEGGMATVYLADDIRHERKVALKVLKPELSAVVGGDRFLTEIKTTANLHHPHILPLFDSGQADGFLFYVMPYVEDETLRDRLDRERQLPVDEAVRITVAVAQGLQHAHDRGVVHRDIKPGNILLQDGQPVLADFGIALAVGAAGGTRLTETGLSVGTPYYMSPEQATGDQAVGPASDVYALCAVLYETLTGDPPHSGSTAQAVLVKILKGDPVSAREHRNSVPRHVDAAIRKGLERLPADRFPTASALARALQDPDFRHGDEASDVAAAGGTGRSPSRWVALSGWLVGVVALGVLGLSALRPEPAREAEYFPSPFPAEAAPGPLSAPDFDISRDGRTIAYMGPGQAGNAQSLWIRRLGSPDAQVLDDITAIGQLSLSPDGSKVAFVDFSDVLTISLNGGAPRVLAEGSFPVWDDDGHIYFQTGLGSLARIPETGGPVDTLAALTTGWNYITPREILADPAGALVATSDVGNGGFSVYWFDFENGGQTRLVEGEFARLSPTGHLLWTTLSGTLMAATFDPRNPTEMGPAFPVIDGAYSFDLSDSGRLLYSSAGSSSQLELVWFDRQGTATPVAPGWAFNPGGTGNAGWALSPDETRVAVRERTEAGDEIWVKELPDGPHRRLTFHPAPEFMPRWTADGERVTFISDRMEGDDRPTGVLTQMQAWVIDARGSGDVELLHDPARGLAGAFLSPDEEWLILRYGASAAQGLGLRDVVAVRMDGSGELTEIAASPEFTEQAPALSPDGRWVAYTSNETGDDQIFIRPFPDARQRKVQVSRDGGLRPVWSHSGRELFFVDVNRRELLRAGFDPESGQVAGVSLQFSIPPGVVIQSNSDFLHISRDDQRFLMARSYQEASGREPAVVLVTDFLQRLESRSR